MADETMTPSEPIAVILARMEVKLDHSLTRGDDHEARLRVLERKVWSAAGLATVAATGLGAALARVLGVG